MIKKLRKISKKSRKLSKKTEKKTEEILDGALFGKETELKKMKGGNR